MRHAHADTRNQTIQETKNSKNSSVMAINKNNQEMQVDNNLGNISHVIYPNNYYGKRERKEE